MTANEFARICQFHCVDPAIALDSETVRSALRMAKEYPPCMAEDARALVEDAVAGES